jgi:hypothetical protein
MNELIFSDSGTTGDIRWGAIPCLLMLMAYGLYKLVQWRLRKNKESVRQTVLHSELVPSLVLGGILAYFSLEVMSAYVGGIRVIDGTLREKAIDLHGSCSVIVDATAMGKNQIPFNISCTDAKKLAVGDCLTVSFEIAFTGSTATRQIHRRDPSFCS